jgi:hypothetical protein
MRTKKQNYYCSTSVEKVSEEKLLDLHHTYDVHNYFLTLKNKLTFRFHYSAAPVTQKLVSNQWIGKLWCYKATSTTSDG